MIRHPFFRRCIFLLVLPLSIVLGGDRNDRKIAEQYAPVLYQEAHSIKLDQVTRFDFDGNWNGADNWANAYLYPSPGHVYYAVIEADRHFIIYYAFFHIRDFTTRILEAYAPKIEHENDMEGMVLVVPKDAGENPQPIYMETLAHDRFYKYVSGSGSGIVAKQGKIDGVMEWEDGGSNNGWHPVVFIESEGHGVFGLKGKYSGTAERFPGFIYRFTGRKAEEPLEIGDTDVSYDLLPIEEHLWSRRLQIGSDKTYCCSSSYQISGRQVVRLGSAFNGPIGGCAAKPPWGWDQRDDGDVRPGEWFINPVYALGVHVEIPQYSTSYRYNPFFTETQSLPDSKDCLQGGSDSRSVGQSTLETALGIGQVLLSGGKIANVGTTAQDMFLKKMEFLEWSSQPEMSRWQFLDKKMAPVFEAKALEGRNYRTRLEVDDTVILNSPLFTAPVRFYKNLVLRYRTDRQLSLTVGWHYSDQSDFSKQQISDKYSLSPGKDWNILLVPLADLKKYQKEKDISRWQLQIHGGKPSALLEVQYIVFDRLALSDTFR